MWINRKKTPNSFTFTKVILDGKIHFLYCEMSGILILQNAIFTYAFTEFLVTHLTLREKWPNTEFFLVRIFPIARISLYSVQMRENTDQKKFGHFPRSLLDHHFINRNNSLYLGSVVFQCTTILFSK